MIRREDMARIRAALLGAQEVLRAFTPGHVEARMKEGDDPVTEADLAVDAVLYASLPQPGEGWLSEETIDDHSRLDKERVWVVDPLDGTREFVAGIPEWCVSIGLVERGMAVAGGILNPATGEMIIGAQGIGVFEEQFPVRTSQRASLQGALVLASRSEVRRGQWARFDDADFTVKPCGSVAYKLALVATGQADATWTLVPKNAWDVAAGVALVTAGGGKAFLPGQSGHPELNQADPLLPGLVACGPDLVTPIRRLLAL